MLIMCSLRAAMHGWCGHPQTLVCVGLEGGLMHSRRCLECAYLRKGLFNIVCFGLLTFLWFLPAVSFEFSMTSICLGQLGLS